MIRDRHLMIGALSALAFSLVCLGSYYLSEAIIMHQEKKQEVIFYERQRPFWDGEQKILSTFPNDISRGMAEYKYTKEN